MNLKINDDYFISEIMAADKAAYLEHLQEKQIADQTLNIPYPYTEADADWWINHNIEATKTHNGRSVDWAIRRLKDGFLIGGIGFHGLQIGKSHHAELGYWLAKPYWGKGIMTEAVIVATEYAFRELGLYRITGHVFDFNQASAKVLEKAGYRREGHVRGHYRKNGRIFDGFMYAMIADDLKKSRVQRPDFIKHYLELQEPDTAHYPDSDELLSIGSPFAKKLGLKNFGIHHEVLLPGRRTSWPHAESHEEEFAYVIEGHPDVWIDGHLYPLNPGDAVAFSPGTGVCHTFINNTESAVRLLVVGDVNKAENKCVYALHPDRNEKIKAKGFLWENPPRHPQGDHDGLPDKLRNKIID